MRLVRPAARSGLLAAALITAPLALAACNRADDSAANAANESDPAARAALEDPIMVDPDLADQSNRDAATTGSNPATGGIPLSRQKAVAKAAQADAAKAAGGRLMRVPAGTPMAECKDCDANEPVTLGARAANQSGGKCDADLSYGAQWADRMPDAFGVYPRAALREAAGVSNGECNVRIVNFRTGAPLQSVLDYYYTRARRAGYDGEHTVRGGEHYLGGTRSSDGAAYVVIVNEADGLRDVDIVASNGR